MKRLFNLLFIIIIIIISFGLFSCTTGPDPNPNPLTPEEVKAELADLGWSMGNQFRDTQSPETVQEAITNIEIALQAEDILLSQDLINAGIKFYLMQNPEYSMYYSMAKSLMRILGVKLPTVDILKESGLDLSQFKPEYITVFLVNFLKGLKGQVS